MNAEVNNTAPDVASTWILDLMLQNQAKLTAETTQWFINMGKHVLWELRGTKDSLRVYSLHYGLYITKVTTFAPDLSKNIWLSLFFENTKYPQAWEVTVHQQKSCTATSCQDLSAVCSESIQSQSYIHPWPFLLLQTKLNSLYYKVDIQMKTKPYAQKHSFWYIIFSLFLLCC